MAFIEPCFGIGHNLSLICQMTSEDIKHQLIIIITIHQEIGDSIKGVNVGNSIHQEIGDSIKGVDVGNSIHQEIGDSIKGVDVGNSIHQEIGETASRGLMWETPFIRRVEITAR